MTEEERKMMIKFANSKTSLRKKEEKVWLMKAGLKS